MIKQKGNIQAALKELSQFTNATSHIFTKAQFGEGPLSQTTFTLKANFAIKNQVVSASSHILEHFVPGYNASVLAKFKAAGAALVAQTHGDEFGLGGTGLNSAFGEIRNPLNPDRLVGGSSSGAAATLTPNISIAIGSDTGDSVRTPASFVGKVGFKPSYGAISRYGLYAFATSLDTVGFLTHNVHDAIIASQIAYGADKRDMTSREVTLPDLKTTKPQKIAVLKNLLELYPQAYQAQFQELLQQLKADGIEIIFEELDPQLLASISIVYQIIAFSEASSNLANLDGINFGEQALGKNYQEIMTKTRSEYFGSLLQRRLTLGAYFLSRDHQTDIFLRAQKVRRLLVETFNKIYAECDFLLSPATPIAPLYSESKQDRVIDNFLIHSNFEGSPSIVLPFGHYQHMPYGVVLDAAQDNDRALMRAALYLETKIGGQNA